MTSIRLYLEIAAAVVLLAAFGAYTVHERHKGEQAIEASDAKVAAAAKALADAQTLHEQVLSTQAQQAAQNEQKAIDNYALTHPVGVVRVCLASNSGSLPKAGSNPGVLKDPAGPLPLSAVPDATPGPNIGPGLAELVQAAATVATQYREYQQR